MNGIAATVGANGRQDMFYLDPAFSMKQRFWDGTKWTAQEYSLGGTFTSVPVAVATLTPLVLVVKGPPPALEETVPASLSPGTAPATPAPAPTIKPILGGIGRATEQRLDVFGIGTDYAMYHKALLGAPADNPGPWENLGGVFTSAPTAFVLGGNIHVFGLGTDYAMYHRVWNGNAWSSAWENLDGKFSSAATVVSSGAGQMDVFARGSDFTLRHRSFANNTWSSDWENLSDQINLLASPPVAVSWGANRLDVFAVRNLDGTIIHRWWDGMIWNDWEQVMGSTNLAFTSMPAAVTWGPNRLDVFAVGIDSVFDPTVQFSGVALYHIWQTDDAWSLPETLLVPKPLPLQYGVTIEDTPTVLVQGVNRLDLIAPGSDQNLYHQQWNNAWQPGAMTPLGGVLRLPSRYVFSMDDIKVEKARSLDSDTDTAQVTLAAGNWPTTLTVPAWPYATKTQSLGDLGGTEINAAQTNLLNVGPVTVELCESSIFNYTIVNAADPASVASTITAQGVSLADSGVKTIVKDIGAGIGITSVEVTESLAIPLIGSLLGLLSSWLIGQLNSIINAKCDGAVAIEQVVLMGKDLQVKTKNKLSVTTIHNGTDSPTGCGSNSVYRVNWSITQT